MKRNLSRFLLSALVCCLFIFNAQATPAGTVLAEGDLIFTAYDAVPANADGGDRYSFVVLNTITAGTVIYFTERGIVNGAWQAAGSSEGTVSWTVGADLSVGDEVYIHGLAATVNGTANGTMADVAGGGTNGLSLSAAGDQIMAFQGAAGDPTASTGIKWIAGIHWSYQGSGPATNFTPSTTDASWDPSNTFLGPNSSSMPTGLTGNFSAFWIGMQLSPTSNAYSNANFNGTGKPYANAAAIRTAVMNKNNWDKYPFNGTVTQAVVPSGQFAPITPCTPPSIGTSPSAASTCSSGSTSFTVSANNATSYQWEVSTGSTYSSITNGGVYSNATTATLNITGVTTGMNGYSYRCVATSACSPAATSSGATLTVLARAVITSDAVDRSINVGGNTTFDVTSSNATAFQWQVDDGSGSGYTDISNGGVYSGATTGTLTITGATVAMSGYKYHCNVTAACAFATTTNNRTLTVNTCTAPVVNNPANRTICAAGSTTLQVIATGATGYQWQVDQTGGGTFTDLSNTAPYSGVTTNTLTITAATGGMSGYKFRVKAINGVGSCFTASNASTLTVSNPTASITTQTDVACNGGNTGAATLLPSGGIPTYTYSWAPSGGTAATATGLTAQTYTVTITDNIGCTGTQNVLISQPQAITSSVTSQTSIACNSGTNGAAAITAGGGTGTLTYNWTPGNPTGDGTVSVSGLSAGVWTCTITDANSCTKLQTVNITQPTSLTSSVTSQTSISCNGGTNGAAAITAGGGTGGFTYNWTPGNPAGDGTVSVTGLSAGVWTCTITDANACTKLQTVNITQPASITSSVTSQTNISCNGGTNGAATITAGGGTGTLTYDWTPGNPTGDGTVSVSGLTTGVWTCTITDANSCTKLQTVNITQPTSLTSSVTSQTNVSCNSGSNGTTTITAGGGTGTLTYDWTPGNPTGDGTVSITGLSAGVYTCTITDANSCTKLQTVNITQPTSLTSSVTSQTNISCNGGTNGAATITAGGGTGGFTYDWTPGNPTGDGTVSVTGLSAGVWTCTITDANACTKLQTVNITQPTSITSSITSQTNISCNSGTNGAAIITAGGGTGTLTYDWTPGNPAGDGTVSVTGLSAGVWTCTITDANACTKLQTVNITQPTSITSSVTSQTNISCNSGSNGTTTITAGGGTGTLTYDWTPGNPTGDGTVSVTGLSVGVYTCTITDANACTKLQTVNITQPTSLTSSVTSQTNVSCNGGTNGAATITAGGGMGGFTYDWTPGNPTGDGTVSVSGLSAGIYTCTITDANACTKLQTVNITQPTSLTSSVTSQTNISCNGGTNGAATITAGGGTGGFTYDWTPGNPTGDGTVSVSGLSAGIYTCTITDANACTKLQTVNITQPTSLTSSVTSQTNISCNGGTNGAATITAGGGTGGFTYDWTPGNPTGDGTVSVSGLSAGVYTCTITDANSCTKLQTVNITQPTAITATTSQTDVLCNGGANGTGTVTPTGGTGAYTYVWAPTGGTAATATGLSSGTYTITIADANLCSITKNITITQPDPITATTSQINVSCNSGTNGSATVTPTGGTGTYTYVWTPTGGTAATASGLAQGNYTVIVKDANLCMTTKSVTITEPTAITATTSQTNVSCNGGTNGTGTVTPTGGTGTYTYVWAPTGGTAATASGLASGTYTITIKDANLCTATKNITITQPTPITATTSQTDVSCNGGTNGTGTVTPTGGTGTYTYVWAPSGGTAATASGLASGTYTITIKDANLCSIIKNITVTQPTPITATTSQTDVSCNNGSNGTGTVTPTGGTGAYTYSWAPNGGTAATANGLAQGTYTVTITDANLCTLTKNITITQPTAITATTSQTNVACNGASTGTGTVTPTGGTGAYTYSWAPSGGTAATATGLAAGTYTVTISDANLCSTIKTLNITQPTPITATATQTNVLCNGGSTGTASVVATGGTGTLTYAWTPTGGTAAIATGLAQGTYTVTITDANTCTATKAFTITQPAVLAATNIHTDLSCNGGANGTATVLPTGGTTPYGYVWTPSGGTAATASGLAVGTYTCIITDANLCTTTQTVTLTQPTAITATVAQTNVLCNGAGNGTATVTATGGTGTLGYAWTPNGGVGPSASGLGVGTYTVTIHDANNCTITKTATITEPAVLTATATQTNATCGNNDGTATVTPAGGNTTYSYNWLPSGGTAATASSLAPGTYTCTITDNKGCVATQQVTIDQPAPAVIVTQPVNTTTCDNSNAIIVTKATGSNLQYAWQTYDQSAGWLALTNTTPYSNVTGDTLYVNPAAVAMTGTQYRLVITTGSCVTTSDTVALTVNTIGQWLGAVSTDWFDPNNWGCNTLPTSLTDIVIDSMQYQPLIATAVGFGHNITINHGATVTVTGLGNALDLKGNMFLNGNGDFNARAGKLTLSGTDQDILPNTYKELVITGGGKKTLTGAATVTGVLTLDSGWVMLNNQVLTLDTFAIAAGGSAKSHIVTNDTGRLAVAGVGAVPVICPVATDTATYTPVTLTNDGDADNFTVYVADSAYSSYNAAGGVDTALTTNVVNRTWHISEAVTGGSNLTLAFGWSTAEELMGFDRNACYAAHYDTASYSWSRDTTSAALGTVPYQQSITGVTTLSAFAIASAPSPVKVNTISNATANHYTIYPNPVGTEELRIRSEQTIAKMDIRIIDVVGRVLQTFNIRKDGARTNEVRLDVSSLSQGTYLLEVTDEKNQVSLTKFNKL